MVTLRLYIVEHDHQISRYPNAGTVRRHRNLANEKTSISTSCAVIPRVPFKPAVSLVLFRTCHRTYGRKTYPPPRKENWPRARAVVLCQGQATPDYTHSVNTCTPAAPPLFCSTNKPNPPKNHCGLHALYREREILFGPPCLLLPVGGGRGREASGRISGGLCASLPLPFLSHFLKSFKYFPPSLPT